MMQNLLIVDDDARISELLVRFLRGQDFDITSASDGTVAIDHILREEPDLVILDLMLPEMSGIEVCKRIRPQYQNPIIMLTAHDNEISEVEALNAGIDDYLAISDRDRLCNLGFPFPQPRLKHQDIPEVC